MVLSVLEQLTRLSPCPTLWVSTQDPAIEDIAAQIPFKTIPNQANAVQSFLKAIDSLPPSEWVLLISGDHPLITTEMLNHFIQQAIQRQASLVVAVVEKQTVRTHYPESQRTYFQAKDGAFSGGNLFLVNRRHFSPNTRFMETIDQNRKKPWKSVFLLNPLDILLVSLKRLTLSQIAARASKALGCSADVVIMPYAECCMDVDKPSDLEMAERILAQRQRNQEHATNKHLQPEYAVL